MPKHPSGWANAQTTAVTRYGADPHNPAMAIIRNAWAHLQGMLVPVVIGGRWGSGSYHGVGLPPLQNPTTAVAHIGTRDVYKTGPANTVAQATDSVTGDPIRRILAERLANGVNL